MLLAVSCDVVEAVPFVACVADPRSFRMPVEARESVWGVDSAGLILVALMLVR